MKTISAFRAHERGSRLGRGTYCALLVLSVAAPAYAEGEKQPKTSQTKTTGIALSADGKDAAASNDGAREEERHLRGLELVLRPSFGSAGGASPVRYAPSATGGVQGGLGSLADGASVYSGGFVGDAMIGYRFHPIVSAGLRAGLRSASADALGDGSENLSRQSWNAGFYARAYPLALTPSIRKYLDPWVGVGVGYMRDVQSFGRSVQNIPADWTLDHHAVAVPLGVGVDYRVLPMLSVGPSFEYTLANAVAGCVKVTPKSPGFAGSSYCSNEGVGQQFIKAEGYGVWSAGLDVKATF